MKKILFLVALGVCSACREENSSNLGIGIDAKSTPSAEDIIYCGGEAPTSTVQNYFNRINVYDTRSIDVREVSNLYAPHVTVVDHGITTRLTREEIVHAQRPLLSDQEWRAIGRYSPSDLKSAGWRGCILGTGEVSFEAAADGTFGLSTFDRDRFSIRDESQP
jgi:hypothetical protein